MEWSVFDFQPPNEQVESVRVLKLLNEATRALADLKGYARTIPNQEVLISALSTQEAQQSSAIENIITTQDELYKGESEDIQTLKPAVKEVRYYARALRKGYELLNQHGLLTLSTINTIQKELVQNDAGIRKLPGTVLKNAISGEVIYQPPQDPADLYNLMDKLIVYLNDDSVSDLDPLLKMAISHHQFESIHPYYDGNGRTGRILINLFLVLKELIDIPILYISRYILQNKMEYYKTIQDVRESGNWEDYLLFMLKAVAITAKSTAKTIEEINHAMTEVKQIMKHDAPNIYSHELLNHLFAYPYTKIDFIAEVLDVSRPTAVKYLTKLEQLNVLTTLKSGRNKYFINFRMVRILDLT